MEKRIFWIDLVRGTGIIAVVICHQQGLLHQSEGIQCFTLYSVVSLIMAMGFTKGVSFRKYLKSQNSISILKYSFLSIRPVVLSYLLVSYVTDISINKIYDNFEILNHIVNFNAAPTFYFIGHFIKLSLWAPLIYFVLNWCYSLKEMKRIIITLLVFLGIWITGYISIDTCDLFSQSYLFIYSLGMYFSMNELPQKNLKFLLGSILTLAIGIFFVTRFYFARVAGNHAYSELIDILDPKLQLNPPNLSIIIYSFGVIGVLYSIAPYIENMKYISKLSKIISILGKYSLDIFLWHMYIQRTLNVLFLNQLNNMWIRRIVYYVAMFFVPVLMRNIYTTVACQIKNKE